MCKKYVKAKLKIHKYDLIKLEGDKVVKRETIESLEPLSQVEIHKAYPEFLVVYSSFEYKTYVMPANAFFASATPEVNK